MASDRTTSLGIVRGISYGLFAAPDEFMPQLRQLGAGLARVYVYWAQVEPRPGEYDWRVVDAIVDQLEQSDELWVTVCSSSQWATKVPTDFLPPSPALDADAFTDFVRALAQRFAGRVRYWQCNNEPSNAGLLWAGSADEYVQQAKLFAEAVRTTDPSAHVVLGGCGYDVLSSPAGSPPRAFFDVVARDARDSFDLFSVHLYDDPYRIAEHVETARDTMRAHGYERPVVVGEYNGPTLFEFPDAMAALEQTMAAAFSAPADGDAAPVDMSTGELAAQIENETPDRRALRQLYAKRDEQPRELRMFMHDAPEDVAALRNRIACRQLAQRALLILSTGVDTLTCWNLAPEVANYTDPFNIMGLMFGTLTLMDYEDGRIAVTHPEGHAHRLVASMLGDATRVERLEVEPAADSPELYAFRIHVRGGGTRLAAWARADAVEENLAAQTVRLDWPHPEAHAIDVFGTAHPVRLAEAGAIELEIAETPVFVTPGA